MKNLTYLFLLCLPIWGFAQSPSSLNLWYKQPAKKWTEALPIGNGKLGGMVHGGIAHELIQLNEESVWAGSKIDNNNPEARRHLPAIQQAIFENRFEEAKDLASQYMVGTPPRIRSYQPLGDWTFEFPWKDAEVSHYKRSLSLQQGVHETSYEQAGIKLVQRSYVSALENTIIWELESSEPIDFKTSISRARDVDEYAAEKDFVYYRGQIKDQASKEHGPGGAHMRFNTGLTILHSDGAHQVEVGDSSAGYRFNAVRKVVLALTANTDYVAYLMEVNPQLDPFAILQTNISRIRGAKSQLRAAHIKEHEAMFNRVSLQLAGSSEYESLPTDERLINYKTDTKDLGLPVLFYQYGRYLLMSSSRSPGALPANLQGLWNQDYAAAWNSDFHTNINLQMNYWLAESANLQETGLVLLNFMNRLVIPGTQTAKQMYGTSGWTLHHLTDPFGRTGVADGVWGVSPMSGPWMCLPLYEHYAFSQDKQVLEYLIYPVIKGSVEWLLGFLVKSPEGYLVTNPSHSPENSFKAERNGQLVQSQLSYASTIDIQIMMELFSNFEEAAGILGKDAALVQQVQAVRKQLPPVKIGKAGTIQEWIKDYEEVEPGHRHMSHLLGLYPGRSISPRTPELYEAAKKTIARRLAAGGGHTGWSKAWIVNFYARLLDGELANKHLQELIGKTCLPNLFSTHPPFQIDGNLGGAAGVAEMLLQSHMPQEIQLLPAIPASWASGSFRGFRARGGYILSLDWSNHRVDRLSVWSPQPKSLTVRYGDTQVLLKLKKGENHFRQPFK